MTSLEIVDSRGIIASSSRFPGPAGPLWGLEQFRLAIGGRSWFTNTYIPLNRADKGFGRSWQEESPQRIDGGEAQAISEFEGRFLLTLWFTARIKEPSPDTLNCGKHLQVHYEPSSHSCHPEDHAR